MTASRVNSGTANDYKQIFVNEDAILIAFQREPQGLRKVDDAQHRDISGRFEFLSITQKRSGH
jgi:hypothetical protein